eukprot:2805385-Rhodomonas_salina.2
MAVLSWHGSPFIRKFVTRYHSGITSLVAPPARLLPIKPRICIVPTLSDIAVAAAPAAPGCCCSHFQKAEGQAHGRLGF